MLSQQRDKVFFDIMAEMTQDSETSARLAKQVLADNPESLFAILESNVQILSQQRLHDKVITSLQDMVDIKRFSLTQEEQLTDLILAEKLFKLCLVYCVDKQ